MSSIAVPKPMIFDPPTAPDQWKPFIDKSSAIPTDVLDTRDSVPAEVLLGLFDRYSDLTESEYCSHLTTSAFSVEAFVLREVARKPTLLQIPRSVIEQARKLIDWVPMDQMSVNSVAYSVLHWRESDQLEKLQEILITDKSQLNPWVDMALMNVFRALIVCFTWYELFLISCIGICSCR